MLSNDLVIHGVNVNRLREAILRIVKKSENDPGFSRHKLCHLLYLIDYTPHNQRFDPVCDLPYVKLRWGVCPQGLGDLLRHMESRKEIDLDSKPPKTLVDIGSPCLNERELGVLEELLRRYEGKSSKELRREVKQSLGWDVAGSGEIILHGISQFRFSKPTPADIEYAKTLEPMARRLRRRHA